MNITKFEKLSNNLEQVWEEMQSSHEFDDGWAQVAPSTEVGRLEDQAD